MIILAIDTSNQTLALGLLEDGRVLGQIQTTVKKNHSVTLMPALDSLVQSVGKKPSDIDRIVVAQGPGSYTGLRIGVTTAKTLAYTLKKELVGLSSLATIAANCLNQPGRIVPLFDARRRNVYAGIYQWEEDQLVCVQQDSHLSITHLLEELAKSAEPIYFVGTDVANFSEEILATLPQAEINTHASWDVPNGITLAVLGEKAEPTANIQDFLPAYLKRVEAEEKWLETHNPGDENYVEKV
ncbi:tRNA N6-adenosine(37)-N6-threonylcarbamoyltransferase complex dimerization subunit TsaB [Enterococcus sp. JM4C]|uniref:tRNA (adenosine(37)-N6)-threonylcarbamoyltransferase complex dimerization subunit type 1 TsaB n=1 Tax=Candidatus Enterococcus huntleyi TaxID=1857217 RepID=UPI001379DF13|nr:tRNA (adenosine(37)-N6)-threonylcarbamoyltransferase complex dimerization subunit type 1 TsaB [Enterococcus sp. JM4C]KAF1296782.1 tRNA N6-adenosine(37)-N6-threonylcarbamoyltransferase complex dimerization subunit TsaB [Enterococcus sp. JM4C]